MASPELDEQQKRILKHCAESVVVVKGESTIGCHQGSGILWDQTQSCWYVVTSGHCVPDGSIVSVTFSKKRFTFKATVVGTIPDIDTALLRIEPFNWEIKPVVQVSDAELYLAKPLTMIGFPELLQQGVSKIPPQAVIDGKICSFDEPIKLACGSSVRDAIFINADITRGFSGGGASDHDGGLLGMICAAWLNPCCNSSRGYGVAIPVKTIFWRVHDLIQEDKKTESLRHSVCIDINALASTSNGGMNDLYLQADVKLESAQLQFVDLDLLPDLLTDLPRETFALIMFSIDVSNSTVHQVLQLQL